MEEVVFKNKLNMYVPDDVLNKIQELCSLISVVEWSGILLYEIEGTLSGDPKDVKILVRDIIPMDKGDASFTSFEYNEKSRDSSQNEDRHLDYITEKEEAELYRTGLVHSHHNMNTYFSQTDMKELHSSAPGAINFLSLIVNNKMEFAAKLAFIGSAEKSVKMSYTARNEFGEDYRVGGEKATIDAKIQIDKLFIYDCEIHRNEELVLNNPFNNLFHKALSNILAKKDSYSGLPKGPRSIPNFKKMLVPNFKKMLVPNFKKMLAKGFEKEQEEDLEDISRKEILQTLCHSILGKNFPIGTEESTIYDFIVDGFVSICRDMNRVSNSLELQLDKNAQEESYDIALQSFIDSIMTTVDSQDDSIKFDFVDILVECLDDVWQYFDVENEDSERELATLIKEAIESY